MPKLNQRGIVPIVLIIIFTVIIAGVAGVVYKSTKEIRIRQDKTSETVDYKGTPAPSPKKADIDADKSGALAQAPFKQTLDNNNASSPKFSITPPAGWEKLPPNGNVAVEFSSPSKDKITEGVASLKVQPNITVFIDKRDFKDFDEVVKALNQNGESFGYQKESGQKSRINGEDVYISQSTIDLADMARQVLENQVKQEIARSGQNVQRDLLQKDMDKVIAQAKGRALSYYFYKNGYYINVTGKALELYWDQRQGQLKQSMDTFKFE